MKPILVLGGGPSFKEALELVPADYPHYVISANEHGFKQTKFKVDYIAYVDLRHGRQLRPTKTVFKQYGVPTISWQQDADYVIEKPRFGRSAGFLAIQAAVELFSGYPVIVAGVDCTVGARPYFWQESCQPLKYNPGAKDRAARVAEAYPDCRRMPSMDAFPTWRIYENPLHPVGR